MDLLILFSNEIIIFLKKFLWSCIYIYIYYFFLYIQLQGCLSKTSSFMMIAV